MALHKNRCSPTITGIAALLLASAAAGAFAEECAPTTDVKGFILGDSVDVARFGEYEIGTVLAKGTENSDHNLLQLDGAYGFGERFQLQGRFDQKRFIDGGLDHAVFAGAGYRVSCSNTLPRLRLDFGFHHDGGNGPDLGFVTGQGFDYLSWQLGVHHSTAISTTRYHGALTMGEGFIPLVFEAAASDTDEGWDRSLAWAIYPFLGETLEAGLAYVDGSGISEGERHVVLRLTATF